MARGADGQLRVVVTGGRGRLGAALCRAYSERYEVVPLSRAAMCLSDSKRVAEVVGLIDFDVLINTAAYTTVDECERDRDLAYAINAHAAASMAEVCRDRGARMIQLSTDFVFDGAADAPYTEGDATNPINIYGQSKLLGEARVLAALDDALVARVSWVFGPDKPGFPEWLVAQVREREVVEVPGGLPDLQSRFCGHVRTATDRRAADWENFAYVWQRCGELVRLREFHRRRATRARGRSGAARAGG